MSGEIIVYGMIGLCVLAIMMMIFSKPMKLLAKIAINGALGALGFVGMNFLLSPFSLFVGVNALTIVITGILGVPGFVMLYLSKLVL